MTVSKRVLESVATLDGFTWRKRQVVAYLIVFFVVYGAASYGLEPFTLLYQNPFVPLPPEDQWIQQSPIQYIIGYSLFSGLTEVPAFLLTQSIGIIYLWSTMYWLLRSTETGSDSFIWTLVLSPFFLIVFTWFGKPDIFLVASYFGFLASRQSHNYLSPVFLCIGVFSHPQITLFYIIFSIFLRLARFDLWLIVGTLGAYALLSYYLYVLGGLAGRGDFIQQNLMKLVETQTRQPIFSLVATFGWLWLAIIHFRKSVGRRFFIVAVACFLITLATLDHTRVFVLLSIPCLVYFARTVPVDEFAWRVHMVFPIWILVFFQFQKRPNGQIVDSAWSWYWLPKLAESLGFL